MKRWLLCIFTYDRPELLTNLVRSIDAFFPWGDRLVVDDGSSVSQAFGVLQEIGRRPNWRCRIMDRDPRQTFPGFYRNMGVALNYALEQGYDYCFFLEDDLQFVWKKDDYTSYIENVFDICPDAIQIRPRFIWRYLTHFTNIEYIAPAQAYRTERGFETTAIWNLDAVRRHPDYHFICDWKGNPFASRSYLGANSAYWMRRGYRLYLQLDPAVASVRGIESRFFATAPAASQPVTQTQSADGEFLLKPLDAAEIGFLKNREPSRQVFEEYFDFSPIHSRRALVIRKGWAHWDYFLCRSMVDKENASGRSPMPVPILQSWAPTEIPPLPSHMTWDPTPAPGPTWKRLLKPYEVAWVRKVRHRLMFWARFSWRDYLGYLVLKRRLRRERKDLPFRADVESSRACGK